MKIIKIPKGLNIPIDGVPRQEITDTKTCERVGITGADFHGLKPTMAVKVGDTVQKGQLLFTDKKNPGVRFTAPFAGTVESIQRGEKRVFQTLSLKINGNNDEVSYQHLDQPPEQMQADKIEAALNEAGLWNTLKTRPFGKVPALGSRPAAIFVSIMDTEPLTCYPPLVIRRHLADFQLGLKMLARLTSGSLYLVSDPHTHLDFGQIANLKREVFDGPHPAGLVGTHMHFLFPASPKRILWSVDYQSVIAIGAFFQRQSLWNERYVAIAGPQISDPRVVKVPVGAFIPKITASELKSKKDDSHYTRIISGSILNGRTVTHPFQFLGLGHTAISALEEGIQRDFLGWQMPGFNKFSVQNTFVSKLMPSLRFAFTTSTEGSKRAIVPIGSYEKVMPMDTEPTFLLRALASRDTDRAVALGVMELIEEDLSLCTYVCPGKNDYAPMLRDMLTTIEREG